MGRKKRCVKTQEVLRTDMGTTTDVSIPSTRNEFAGTSGPVRIERYGEVQPKDKKTEATRARNNGRTQTGMSSRLDYEHPLLNPMLMENILEYANPDVTDLKSLRSVCKLWNQLTLPKWRQTAVLKLIPDPPLFDSPKTGMGVLEYLRAYRNPKSPFKFSEIPFTRYRLQGFNIDMKTCDQKGTDSKRFWNVIGPLMKYIHLEKCTIERSVDKPFMQLLVRKLPNVEHLAITATRIKTRNRRLFDVRDFQHGSFGHFHEHLKTLTIEGVPDVDFGYLFVLAQQLETIQGFEDTKKQIDVYNSIAPAIIKAVGLTSNPIGRYGIFNLLPNLRHLDLINTGSFMGYLDLDMISKKLRHFKLETFTVALGLHLDRPGIVPADGNLTRIFRSQAKTLQVFKMFKPPVKPPFMQFIYATHMPVLREIHLWGSVVSNFDFLASVPNLKVLYINLDCFDKRDELKKVLGHERQLGGARKAKAQYYLEKKDFVQKMDRIEMKNVSLLQLEKLRIDYAFPEKSWRKLGKWMPNLKMLETILTKETVSVVCGQWKDLRELVCLHESVIQDSDIVCNKSKDTIGNLIDLEKFQLDAFCGESTLSDTCVFNGFLKIPALKSVRICVGKKMSPKAEKMLKESIKECCVIRNYEGENAYIAMYDSCDRLNFKRDAENGLPESDSYFGDSDDEEVASNSDSD